MAPRLSPPSRFCSIAFLVLCACSTQEYRDAANDEVYELVSSAQRDVLGQAEPFTIESNETALRRTMDARGTYAAEEPIEFDLKTVLEIAFENSRQFQDEKEAVYLAGLNLSDRKHAFAAQFFGGEDASTSGSLDESSGSASFLTSLGLDQALEFGGAIGLSLVNSVSRVFITGDKWSFDSAIEATFRLPLLRGAGRRIARESLTQAERDMLYAVRDYWRFHQRFSVSIISQFLSVISLRDQLRNAEENYKALEQTVQRSSELEKGDRVAGFEVDQARQDELRARNRVVNAQASLDRALDDLKITLGLPTTVPCELSDEDIEAMRKEGAKPFDMPENLAIRIALENRQDLIVTRERLIDAERQVVVAEDALGAGLDISGSWTVPTDPRQGFNFQPEDSIYSAGIALDLPLDRVRERNAYMRALINVGVQERRVQEFEDEVRFEVRNALRNLEQARQNYDIQLRAVGLAEKRIENVELLILAGRAATRDLLEARRALVDAKDDVTAALIDYTLSRLELARDLGVLEVDVQEARIDDAIEKHKG